MGNIKLKYIAYECSTLTPGHTPRDISLPDIPLPRYFPGGKVFKNSNPFSDPNRPMKLGIFLTRSSVVAKKPRDALYRAVSS